MKKTIIFTILFLQLLFGNKVFAQDKVKAKDTLKQKEKHTVKRRVDPNDSSEVKIIEVKKRDTTNYKQIKVFDVFDEQPKFNGDEAKFISDNLNYPKEALDNQIQGTVVISAYITPEGKITNLHALSKVAGGCTEEALRIARLSNGKWIPGKVNKQSVTGRKIINIKFTLPADTPKPKN